MLFRHAPGVAFVLTLGVLGEACFGPSQASGGPCEAFGGTCVPLASADQCGGSLPYACTAGVCCNSLLPGAPDGASSGTDASVVFTADATLVHPTVDATVLVDSTLIDAPATMDVTVTKTPESGSQDVATSDAGQDATVSDASLPSDARTADAGDAHAEGDAHRDAKPADAHADAKETKDSGEHDAKKPVEAGLTCNSYASPSSATDKCNVTMCPTDPLCQPNSCFDGEWCHTSTGRCVKPLSVVCDGGPGETCNNYASPSESANKCSKGAGAGTCPDDPACQPNSCFNGEWCHLSTGNCVNTGSVVCDGGV